MKYLKIEEKNVAYFYHFYFSCRYHYLNQNTKTIIITQMSQPSVVGFFSEESAHCTCVSPPDEEPPGFVRDPDQEGEGEGRDPPLGGERVDADELGDIGGVDHCCGQDCLKDDGKIEDIILHALLEDGEHPGLADDDCLYAHCTWTMVRK